MSTRTKQGGTVEPDTPLDDLESKNWRGYFAPTRPVLAALDRKGATSVRDLAALTEAEARAIRGLGAETFKVFDEALALAGLEWREEAEDGVSPPGILIRVTGDVAERLIEAEKELGIDPAGIVSDALDSGAGFAEDVFATLEEEILERAAALEWNAKTEAERLRKKVEGLRG